MDARDPGIWFECEVGMIISLYISIYPCLCRLGRDHHEPYHMMFSLNPSNPGIQIKEILFRAIR